MKNFFGWEENLWVAKYHFHHATASDGSRRNGASGFQIHNILCFAISLLVTSPLPHKTATESVSCSIQTKIPFFPSPKAPHAHRWALLSHDGETETRLYTVTSQHSFFSESWPFKQSGCFCTRDVWQWSRTFGDIDINGAESIRKPLCIPPDTERWQQHSSTTP